MRTRLSYIAFAVLVLAGCVKESQISDKPLEGIILNLVLEDQQTKATLDRDGDADLNENVISNTIDVFFYNESTLAITKEVLGAVRSGSLTQIQTNPNDIEGIFGTQAAGAHCGVFVVANFSGTYQGTPGSRTLTQIKSSLLPAPNWETFPQASFIITGNKQITLENALGSTPVNATIGLSRLAAKVTFDVTVAENATGDSGTWIPDTGNMTVYMVYAMRKATLSADPVHMPATASETYGSGETIVYSQYVDRGLYDTGTTKQRTRGSGASTTTVNSPVYSTAHNGQEKPFYTYPCAWETGSSMEPYMKLIIPWTYGNTTKKYYYKIPFHGNSLESNHWYHISIDVQILGTEQADPPEVQIYYAIANWSGTMDNTEQGDFTSETSVPATVITARYINIPTTEYILYDEDVLTIPMTSSHDVKVVGFNVDNNAYTPDHINNDDNYIGINYRIYNPYLNTFNNSAVNAVRPNYQNDPPTPVVSATGWTITVNGRQSISISHTLNRDMASADFDVAPYTLRFRACHTTESDNYYTDIIVEQRPSIIIQPHHNSDYGSLLTSGQTYTINGVRQTVGNNHTTEDGYVWINGTRTNKDMTSNRSNANFNMYVVETSVLPTTGALANYVLGDPRQSTPVSVTSGKSASDFATGADISGGSDRKMAQYYPAAEDDDHKSFVAPSFRVASSFGTSSAMSRNDAVYRCAVYQEDGYPAGRWRLPTEAEVYYMITLSQKGKIPTLFSPDSSVDKGGYWNANGAIFPLNGGSVETRTITQANSIHSGNHWARCVYDEWFWADTAHETVDKLVWTWGDEAKNTVVKQ